MGIKINDLTTASVIKASDVLPISQDDGAGGRSTLKVNMQQVAAYAVTGVSGMGASLLTTDGYTTLPNGIIIQWGQFTTGTGSDSQNVDITFPKAFPNACFSFVASIGVLITDYDKLAQYRKNKQSISYGIPNKTGVEGQAFFDNELSDGRVIQWHAYGN